MTDSPYDLAIAGSGSAAFSAATPGDGARRERGDGRAWHGGRHLRERRLHPSKAELAAAAHRHRAAYNPFPGVETSADGVDHAALVAGKEELVRALRQDKYLDLVDSSSCTGRRASTVPTRSWSTARLSPPGTT